MSSQSSEWIDKLWDLFPGGFTLIWIEFQSTNDFNSFIASLTEVNTSIAKAAGFIQPSGKVTAGIGGDLPRAAIREVVVKARAYGDEPLTQAFGAAAMAALEAVIAELGMKGLFLGPDSAGRLDKPPDLKPSAAPSSSAMHKPWWQFWKRS